MTYNLPEFKNKPGEILQEQECDETPIPPIPTVITDPVHTLELPTRSGGFRQYTLSTTSAVKILDRDPRRKRAVLTVFDTAGASNGVLLGNTQAEAQSSYAALLPLPGPGIAAGNVAFGPVELTMSDEVWASASGESCVISVINEQWSL